MKRAPDRVIPISDLTPDPRNARRHNERNLGMIEASIRESGAGRSLLIDETGMVIAGNATIQAAQAVGLSKVRVIEADGDELIAVRRSNLTPAQKVRMALLDNRAAELAEWDAPVMEALTADDVAGIFEADELREIVGSAPRDPDAFDDTPPASPSTRPGHLIVMGKHRLLCGDSSDPRDVDRATGGVAWDVVVLDPPFDAAASLWARWIMDPCVVFGQARHVRMIPEKLWRFERVLVKAYRNRSATIQIDHRHAFVVQVGSVKTLPSDKSLTFASVMYQEKITTHHHAKPVSMIVEHLEHWTPPWSVVMDPFAGSGSTLMAAETMKLTAICIERDPAMCDVIVRRWEESTGNKATVSHAA